MGSDTLECVTEYRYLGHTIQRNLSDEKDVESRLQQFYAQFNMIYRKFHGVSIETFMYLFNSYCIPEYGLALWDNIEIVKKHIFKVLRVAYHNALKKIVGVSVSHSSHDVANYSNQFVFEHYFALLQTRYFNRTLRSNNAIIRLCRPFLKRGRLFTSLLTTLKKEYNISFTEYDLDTIKARISWVQRNEICSGIRL